MEDMEAITKLVDTIDRLTMDIHGVTLPRQAILDALESDIPGIERLPTREECCQMLSGNDDDEDVEMPAALRAAFPRLAEELESAWQLK